MVDAAIVVGNASFIEMTKPYMHGNVGNEFTITSCPSFVEPCPRVYWVIQSFEMSKKFLHPRKIYFNEKFLNRKFLVGPISRSVTKSISEPRIISQK